MLKQLGVLFYMFMFVLAPFHIAAIVFTCLICPLFWPLIFWYSIWYWYDRDTPKKGGRAWKSVRYWPIWRYMADYFSANLVKTADIPADRNYIFVSHPHGVFCFGTFLTFGTEATFFSTRFPNMKCHLVTTPLQFRFPLRRELFIAAGIITTDAESIEYVLNKEEKGQLVCIVPGGAEESLDSHPDNYDLTLLNRKGFVRIAIKTGAALVPVYNFGENRCFYQVPNKRGTFIRKLQSWLKRMLGFAPCIWSGVGVLNNYIGFMPFATPITTVVKLTAEVAVGEPLTIPHDPNPSKELIERTHAKYVGALIKLFDDNKARYGIDESVELRIV